MRDFAVSDDPAVQAQLDRLDALSLPRGRLSLDPVRALLARLGDPHLHLPPAFHVAGTNGKGSTCAFLRAILEADGKRIHQYTSPHLVRFNERIRLSGELIRDDMLALLLGEVLDASEDIGGSFFEITTAAAFLAFSRTEADACIVEVGLGGRFDATNLLSHPACCGIASLGIDHERFLLAPEEGTPASPLARIAFEKAGIVKPGVPTVTQAYPLEAEAEIERAAGVAGAPLHMRGKDWHAAFGAALDYDDRHGALSLPLPTMPGTFQADNAALAVAMLRHQDRVTVSDYAMATGIRQAMWPARLQWLGNGPLAACAPRAGLLLDGGHNPDAGRVLADFLSTLEGPVVAICGMLGNKDAAGFLASLAPRLAEFIAVPIPGHEHHPTRALAAVAKSVGTPAVGTAASVEAALSAIGECARPAEPFGGTVLICGSVYLAGEVLRLNGQYPE